MFVSTRGGVPPVRLAEALRQGLAPDGGLFVPVDVPVMSAEEWAGLRGRTLPDVATALIAPLVADTFDRATLGRLMASALAFPIPLVPIVPGTWALELFHGPTLAFKDVGARSMARWLAATAGAAGDGPLTVLVATSGDTGGAVAHAFHRVAGTRVVVLYPRGRVSAVQEAQFATLGDNVTAVSVEGTFDDCQRLVKEAFSDGALSTRYRLTSANSISVGRLLPQMAYYAWAVLQLPAEAPPPVVVVPSGNLGNVTAGLLAARRGVPIARFVAATTVNDPLPRYLVSGRYEPTAAVPTLANAMDVGDPSNFERLQWLFGGDLAAMRRAVAGLAVTDDEIRTAMRDMAAHGYIADPHTAVGWVGAARAASDVDPAVPRVILSTAHPAKFGDVVAPVLGREIPLPPALAERMAHRPSAWPAAPSLAAVTAVLERVTA
jgi:threonine synthase